MTNESLNDFNKNIYYLNEYETLKQITFRITGNLKCNKIASANSTDEKDLIDEQFNQIINNDIQSLSFLIRPSNFIVSKNNQYKSKSKDFNQSCSSFFKEKAKFESIKDSIKNFVQVDLLKCLTFSKENSELLSPNLTNHKGINRLHINEVPIDLIVFADFDSTLSDLYILFTNKLLLQLEAIKQCYLSYYKNGTSFQPEIYHYWVDKELNSLITTVYPNNKNDEQLKPLRKEIHNSLSISIDRPYFRRVDAFPFYSSNTSNSSINSGYLRNPHTSAKPSGIQEGKQTFVHGEYVYFHYMQDFNDNGWGCAYRSFQTIFSWFKLQNYTNLPVPTHRDIQQALYEIGDKSRDFIGSSKWIGSMEISFCLSKFLNVESKIISVSSGSELVEKAREVQFHFETEGTPIMIGGGLYAYTIVGVHFNELTGDVKYCIVDPHYTGSDDIKTIVNKGWCGWKDNSFWDPNVFYNMCCPLKSSMY